MSWIPTKRPSGPVEYTPDPPWDGGSNCAPNMLPSVRNLGAALAARFPAIVQVQGYDCRPNSASPSRTSVHGTGRAIDLMVSNGDVRGDEIGDWLIEHAAELGVQVVIWRGTIWSTAHEARGAFRPYSGPSEHTDHLHVELNEAGANSNLALVLSEATPVDPLAATVAIAAGVAAIAAGVAALRKWGFPKNEFSNRRSR